MSTPEKRGSQRVPVAMRIKLRYRKLDSFISKFATNVSTEGMFISSRKPKEVGTELRFELRLADDSRVISGLGEVMWVRHYDKDNPKEPHGMGVRFIQLSKSSKEMIRKMIASREKRGLPAESGIPYALDTDADEVEASEVEASEGATTTAAEESAPQAQVSEELSPTTPAAPAARSNAPSAANGSPVPMTLEDIDTLPIDMSDAMRRARMLAAKDSGDEALDALYRVSAAPVAASVDEASNELARILGGEAIKAQRLQRRDDPEDESSAPDPKTDPLPMEMGSKR
jgi:uncharacterized protein (TIGR02266 family)